MTKEELSDLVNSLYPKFKEGCERVKEILGKVIWEANMELSDAKYCYVWSLAGTDVFGTGFDEDGEYYSCEFPIEYLTMSDQQLYDLVEQINEDYRKKKEEKRKQEAEQLKEKELEELKRLQEKYKDETK